MATPANDNGEGNPPSYRLTFADAVKVWLINWQGMFQHRIAAKFGVNPGRVNEVLKGHKHAGSREAAEREWKDAS